MEILDKFERNSNLPVESHRRQSLKSLIALDFSGRQNLQDTAFQSVGSDWRVVSLPKNSMANYELTLIVFPQGCGVTVDGRAAHYRDHRTGVNAWHTHRGGHDVVFRYNGVELHMEVDNSEAGELTVYLGTVPEFDSSKHPGAEVTSSSLDPRDPRYAELLKNSKRKDIKKAITGSNVWAAKGLAKGTYYVHTHVRITHSPHDQGWSPGRKLTVID